MKAGTHHPACDTQLGPDFEVTEGEVVMTIFACFGNCWVEPEPTVREVTR